MFNKRAFFEIWNRIDSGTFLFRWINHLTVGTTYFLSTAMLVMVGLADYFTHVELTLSPWYTYPCFLMDWRIGRKSALAYAVFATALQLLIGLTGTHEYPNRYYLVADLILNLAFCIVLIWIIAKLRLALEMETLLSRSDFLTRLANRNSFLEGVEKELKRCQREGKSLTVMMIDLDNFKHFNETRGHSVGDLLLSAMAELLRENFRSTDIIARTGDDEFTLVLPGISADVSESKLQAVRKDLENLLLTRGWNLTFGMAAIALVRPSVSGEQIVREIEHLMQQVKQSAKIGLALQPLSTKMPEPELPGGLEKQPC